MVTLRCWRDSRNQLTSADFTKYLDEVGIYVQVRGGYFSLHRGYIDFCLPDDQVSFALLLYPNLEVVDYTIDAAKFL